jgi:hypothetical protein
MATFANVSNQLAALKELYTGDDYMKDLVYKKNPLLALINKDESPSGFAGKYIPVPMIYGVPQGRSATFSNALSNQTAPALKSFFVYRVSNYAIATITNELIEATKDNAGAFVDESKLVVDTAFRSLSNDVASDLFGTGTGSRGTISTVSTAAGVTTIQLAEPSDVVKFEVGMLIVAAATDGGTPVASTSVLLTAVNRTTGVIKGTPTGTPASSWSAGYFLIQDGDIIASGSNLKISGLGAWLPKTAPTSGDSFWGVDRSSDPTRLSGVRYDGSAQTVEESLIDAASLVAREGGQPEMCFVNFATYSALEKALGSKVQYVDVHHQEADIAFAGMKIHAPYGPISVIPDRSCPAKTAYMLQMDTWKLRSLGKAPHILTYGMEGLEGLRTGTADALEIRLGLYGNLICNAPGFNAVVTTSA